MNRRITIALCFMAICLACTNLLAKNNVIQGNNRIEIIQLPSGPINDALAEKLDNDLERLIKLHNSDPGAAIQKYDGVNRNREFIDLKGYGGISKKTRDYLHDSLHKMIREHNRRIEQMKKREKDMEMQQKELQLQQQMQMQQMQRQQQQMQMQQMQIINHQQQMYRQEMQRRQEEQRRQLQQQEEERRKQEDMLKKQRRLEERQQQELEREQKRSNRRSRGKQNS